ncbi:MAG: NADH-quinone oxidoreductase subunit N [Planctomycetes bacterium]|nr:NADH-quinone oxidoreductase subunit N [Planctomycetota bacterium]
MNLLREELSWITPELCLTLFACVALLVDLFVQKGRESVMVGFFSLMGLLATAFFLYRQYGVTPPAQPVFGCMVVDPFSTLFKLFAVGALAFVVLFTMLSRQTRPDGYGEFYFILLCAGLGAFFLASTYNLLLMYLGLELLSIASYILAGYAKGNRRSGEAAMKYVIFGAVASGVMLYGFTLLYGMTGSIDLTVIGPKLRDQFALDHGTIPISVATGLCLAGFAYKISAAPFHFWTPDVYEGAPTPVTTFLAVASKGAGFAALLRFLQAGFIPDRTLGGPEAMMGYSDKLGTLVAVLAALTMTLGNLAALGQTNLKRMLAYSSIAHAGYVLMGVATMNREGFSSVLFYLVVYYFMNLGAFGVVMYYANTTGDEQIDDLKGLGWRSPLVAITMVAFLVALVGLPPTAGFIGKWFLFTAAVKKGFLWLAVVAGINSAISLFYYFRVARAMWLRPEEEAKYATVHASPAFAALLLVLAVGTVWFGVGFDSLLRYCDYSQNLLR